MGKKAILETLLRPLGFGVYRSHPKHAEQSYVDAALRYKKSVVASLAQAYGYKVQRGVFEGLRLPEMGAWSDYDIVAKIVGSYESELFSALATEIAACPNIVVNIGASEGYYAVGLKRHLPHAGVYTYDIDENSFPALDRCMALNDVKVVRLLSFDYARPFDGMELPDAVRALFVMDCEGYENHVVEMPRSVTAVSSFIIELHDLFVPNTTKNLMSFFHETHDLTLISQQKRDLGDFPELADLRGSLSALMLDEFRLADMQWLYAVPK